MTDGKRRSPGFFGALDGIEAIFYLGGGLVVLVAVVVRATVAAHRVGGAALLSPMLVLLVVVLCLLVRDRVRRRWSPVSIGVAASYVACVGFVLWLELTGDS